MDALKVVSFLRRRPDLSPEAFGNYWRTTHKAHALTLVRAGFFRGYVQNHATGVQPEELVLIADGAPELWIEDLSALDRLLASSEYREGAGPDEENFSVPPAIACVARERVLAGGGRAALPPGAVKLMLVASRPASVPRTQFSAEWLSPRLDWWGAAPDRRPLRWTRQAVEGGEEATAFDGVECSWWADAGSACQAWQAARGRARDAAGTLRGLLVREEVVLPPPC